MDFNDIDKYSIWFTIPGLICSFFLSMFLFIYNFIVNSFVDLFMIDKK